MCNKDIIGITGEIKKGDMSRFNELYESFEGLIKHFERKSDLDDMGEELTLFLLELIFNLDTDRFLSDETDTLNRYISVSLRNKYILLSKRHNRYITEFNELYDDTAAYFKENDKSIALKEGLMRLTEKQRTVIILRYIYGYSDAEIADRLKITRQAANRLENRGLAFLREYFGV